MSRGSTLLSSRTEPTARWTERYQEALDAAAMAFAEKGYLGASLKDVADYLGIRAASLYYYFPSKEAALAAVCELGIRRCTDNVRAIIESREAGREKLRQLIASQLSPLRMRPGADYLRVFLRHRHELPEEPRRHVVNLSREFQKLIQQVFVSGIERGDFRKDLDPEFATFAFLGLCNSVIGARVLPRHLSIDDFIEEFDRLISAGFAQGGSRRRTGGTKASRTAKRRR